MSRFICSWPAASWSMLCRQRGSVRGLLGDHGGARLQAFFFSPARRRLHAGCRLGSLRTSPKLVPEDGSAPGFGIV